MKTLRKVLIFAIFTPAAFSQMIPQYSSYSMATKDPSTGQITTAVTIQGNTTFNPSCTYCYSAWHSAYVTNQISRTDTGVIISGGRQMVANVQPPSLQINRTTYVTVTESDCVDLPDGSPGCNFRGEGQVICSVVGILATIGGGGTLLPQLRCSSQVTRGASASCQVAGAFSGNLSNWKFTAEQTTVNRTSNQNAFNWSGRMVKSGSVSVTASGGWGVLSAPISVTNRTNFAFPVVSPVQLTGTNSITCYSGRAVTLDSPPGNGSQEGYSCADQAFSFNFSTISDGGPNHGYEYVTSASSQDGARQTKFEFIVVSDLLSQTSFYNSQCGDFSSSNLAGFIAGSQLKQNVFDHEQGAILSHWTEYRDAQNVPTNNIGSVLEAATASPGSIGSSFAQNAGNAALNRISQAVDGEPCLGSVNRNSSQSCANCGTINFSPYQGCIGQPVPHCQ